VVGELDPRPGDEVLDRAGDEDLTGTCRIGHACPDVDRDTAQIVAEKLALSGMQAGAHIEAEWGDALPNRFGALNRARWPVEGGDESVARIANLAASVTFELAAHDCVVPSQELAPASVTELRCLPCGVDDVGEKHGCQHSVDLDLSRSVRTRSRKPRTK